MSLSEAAKQLGISESLARQLERRGEFPGAFRLGGRVLVHREQFAEEVSGLARGNKHLEHQPDQTLNRAMDDAHGRLVAYVSGRKRSG